MQTIAVIFGGRSAEHDVSIVTAVGSVIKPLKLTKKYDVLPVYISKDGQWYAGERFGDIKLYSTGKIAAELKKAKPVLLDFKNGLTLVYPGVRARKVHVDVVFPAMHGTFGEDGSLMGLLRMANVPFVGCGLEASVIAMNKLLSHQVVAASGLEGHAYFGFKKSEWQDGKDKIMQELKNMAFPLFVKPVHLGSSIGITRAEAMGELEGAINLALGYDDTVIVEEAVPNLIEVTVPIIGRAENPTVGSVERPLVQAGASFDFETKYMNHGKSGGKKMGDSGSQGYSEIPAKLPAALYERCEDVARQVYQAVGCDGIARIDLLINAKTEKVYFNEINPLPGSLYAHNWSRTGISTVDLVENLVEHAVARSKTQSHTMTTFDTNFLKQF